MTKASTQDWTEALGAEIETTAATDREARRQVERAENDRRRQLAAGIVAWWARFLEAWRRVDTAARPRLRNLVSYTRPGSVELLCEEDGPSSTSVKVTEDGYLKIRQVMLGSGWSWVVELRVNGAGAIEPAPEALAEELLAPFVRRLAAYQRLKREDIR
jgi:hypothetical protein